MLSSVYVTSAALLNFLHLYGSLNLPMDTEHNADSSEGHAEGRSPSGETLKPAEHTQLSALLLHVLDCKDNSMVRAFYFCSFLLYQILHSIKSV